MQQFLMFITWEIAASSWLIYLNWKWEFTKKIVLKYKFDQLYDFWTVYRDMYV
jgi:hypothetical protein